MLKLHGGHYLHPKELDKKTRTFLAILINDFGFSMIGVLIPVFLWIEGYVLVEIALFHIAMFSFRSFTSAVAIHIAWAVGIARALQIGFISALLAVGSMVAVTTLEDPNYVLLGLAALANGVSAGLYWVPRHLTIESITTNKDAGNVSMVMRALETVVITLGPLIGGFVAAYFGSEYALGLSFIFIFMSMLYVIADKQTMHEMRINKSQIRAGDIKNDIIGNLSKGYDMGVALVAWPLFIFIITDKVEYVGALSTISGIIMIPFMFYVASRIDGREKFFLTSGTLIRTLIYPFRAFAATFMQALGVNFIADIGDVQSGAAHISHYYKRAHRLSRIRYTYYMEIMYPIGSAAAWIVIAILSMYFNDTLSLQLSFVSAVLFVPFILSINRIKTKY